jgi:3-keto-5-aminohexanoate cleavage enzyme
MPGSAPLIINVALTGMVPTKDMTPHVPVSSQEILDDVAHCARLGASIVHLHARDENGLPTHRAESFAPLIEGVRRIDPELIVCATCSGRVARGLEKRAEVLELTGDAKPDMGSLTLGSNNFRYDVSLNPPDVIEGLARRMQDRAIKPELEVFEPGMLEFGKYLVGKGLIEEPGYVNILLGNVATSPLSPSSLGAFLALMPAGWTWAVAGIGRAQLDANLMAIASAGHVRVGLEDNIWWDRERTRLATNAILVDRIRDLAELAERPIASPAMVREKLGLSRTASVRSSNAPR